ncbi:MAG: BrnT family toxin [Pyrinomonadaceae bacterium]
MKYFAWNAEKNEQLKAERGISFEEVVFHIENGDLLDEVDHPNLEKYPHQRMYIVRIGNYAFLVPFVQTGEEVFLKTIIPNRKATMMYLGDVDEEDKIG